jgi:Protein of unknown function (DUF3306)
MSDPENFLARWSRLKREAASELTRVGEDAPAEAPQAAAVPSTPVFDPATLPSIESIDAATDIRPFLAACVPEELTRAALRSTWSADPAIRDFVGIAESQWDFNDPATIPGFGVHAAADYVCSLAADGVRNLTTALGTPAESFQVVEQPLSEGSGSGGSNPAGVACQVTAAVIDRSDAAAGDLGPRTTGAHGGALPR